MQRRGLWKAQLLRIRPVVSLCIRTACVLVKEVSRWRGTSFLLGESPPQQRT